MTARTKIAEFIAFCIEAYAKAKGLSGADVCALFNQYGALEYLERGYGVLHTMGEAWLVADLDDYLKKRNHSAHEDLSACEPVSLPH